MEAEHSDTGIVADHDDPSLFNALLHKTACMIDSTTAKNNHVLEELQCGYTTSGRLLRCAMASAARNPNQESNRTKIRNYAATGCTSPKARGIRTAICVPNPGWLVTTSFPPKHSARFRMPISPKPPLGPDKGDAHP